VAILRNGQLFPENLETVFSIEQRVAPEDLVSSESLRTVAKVFKETIHQLEESADIDSHDPAFVSLKSNMLSRAAALVEKADELETGIPLTQPPEPETPPAPFPSDTVD